jgi:co-chaperonin GroES (HSP10)
MSNEFKAVKRMINLQTTQLSVSSETPLKPMKNKIVLELNELEYSHIKVGDKQVYIDTSYEPEKFAITSAKVIHPPNGISPELETDIEVEQGDIVYFHYLCVSNCIKEGRYIIYDGKIYVFINYDSCYVAKRGSNIIMLNGYMLVERVNTELKKTDWGFIIPEAKQSKRNCIEAIVRYIGKPLKSEHEIVKQGQHILIRPMADVPIEYKLFKNFDGKQLYYRIKRDFIYGILK